MSDLRVGIMAGRSRFGRTILKRHINKKFANQGKARDSRKLVRLRSDPWDPYILPSPKQYQYPPIGERFRADCRMKRVLSSLTHPRWTLRRGMKTWEK